MGMARRVASVHEGYVFIWHEGERRREHQVVAEAMIGRPLRPDEEVHHVNEIRSDNAPENLQVLTKSEHMRLHMTKRLRKARR